MTQAEYIKSEFARYYPDADITVYVEDETIKVRVDHNPGALPMVVVNFRCNIGSDDDYYVFSDDHRGQYITIPLQPEKD